MQSGGGRRRFLCVVVVVVVIQEGILSASSRMLVGDGSGAWGGISGAAGLDVGRQEPGGSGGEVAELDAATAGRGSLREWEGLREE